MRALAAAVIRLKCTLHDFLKLLEKKAGSIAAGRKVVKPASDGAEREVVAGYSGAARRPRRSDALIYCSLIY